MSKVCVSHWPESCSFSNCKPATRLEPVVGREALVGKCTQVGQQANARRPSGLGL